MSFPRYPKYKPSGTDWLGDVPEHWEIKRFKYIFKEREERSTDGSELLLSVSAYTGVSPRSEVIDEGDHLSRAESLEGYKVCRKDDLVMNIMLAWNRGLAFTNYDGIVSPAYCVFDVINGSLPRFLDYLVRSNEYTLYYKAFSSGVIDSRLRLYPDTFGSLSCGLPPLPEQTQIANFLDRETAKIDALVSEQRRLIELLKEKRQAVISHAVTRGLNPSAPLKPSGTDFLGDIPSYWEVKSLKYLASFTKGLTITKEDLRDEGIPCVNYGEIHSKYGFQVDPNVHPLRCVDKEYLDTSRSSLLSFEDFVFADTSEDYEGSGNFTYLNSETPTFAGYHTIIVRLNGSLKRRFFAYLFDSEKFRSQIRTEVSGIKVFSISQSILKNSKILIPSLAEQIVIVRHLDAETAKFDSLTAEAERVITLLQERRTALISAAVTGQIDVQN